MFLKIDNVIGIADQKFKGFVIFDSPSYHILFHETQHGYLAGCARHSTGLVLAALGLLIPFL